tara:strand:+ start:73 stop:1599 length:1527 start_codon:yes stop_codon:yes gene_type:complete
MTKPLDILFVHPNASDKIYQSLGKDHSAIEPPIWAGMLANHCRSRGYSVSILDCEAQRINYEDSVKEISYSRARLICFVVYGQQPSASTQNMQGAVDTADLLKKTYPEIKTLFLGGHISALPRETLSSEPSIDMVCLNEGVYTLSNLLCVTDFNDEKQLSKIKGLGFKSSDNSIIINSPEAIVPKNKLEHDLPGIAWDLLPDIKKYRTAGWHSWSNESIKSPFASIYTSLGCPYTCSFCMINIINRTDNSSEISSQDSNIFRWWRPEFIIEQFDQIALMGVKNIKIADELFVLNPNHFMKICDLLIERDYGFNIWCYSRIDTCKPKYLEKLKKAGINWLGLGIENPSTSLRKEIHKGSYREVIINDVFDMMRKADINIAANYIFGLPMDTQESMKNTLEFAIDNLSEMVNFYCAMSYPGSPLYLEAIKNKWQLPATYSGYSQHAYDTLNLQNETLSSSEILAFRDKAWDEYHTNKDYLGLIERKFGFKARKNIEQTTKIKLKRKILGE